VDSLTRRQVLDSRLFAFEHRFQRYDKHAVEAFRIEPVPWLSNGIHQLPGVDARLLKLYFMHVLWRAHASSLSDMEGVDLRDVGCDKRLRSLLLADDAGGPLDFAINLARFDRDPDGLDGIIAVPTRSQWRNKASAYDIWVGRWWVTITDGSGGPPAVLLPYTLQPGKPVPVATGAPYRDSPMLNDALEVMRSRSGRP